ncbi:MAG: hypothetical protein DCF12_14475 [Snowella sp.]|jgi:hypothetical protein|nr:MAG: hypothetical protein DCF12_14475 [Snowella sp.]
MTNNHNNLEILKDERANCYSVMITLSVEDYLSKISNSFENKGGIEGQRETLKTKTSKRIRERMVDDLEKGAILPPIVIGTIINQDFDDFINTPDIDKELFLAKIKEIDVENIFIIDGMQRTAALKDALEKKNNIAENKLRIEYWLASKTDSITYRMLVLNTGQIPWNLRRQIEVVFKPITKEIESKIEGIKIIEVDDSDRRKSSGEFRANDLIEMYMVFGAKRDDIDLQERLADEFTKQDFIESIGSGDFNNMFCEVIKYLFDLDECFGKFIPIDNGLEGQFKKGSDLFRSQPACVGFVTAFSIAIMGRPGIDVSEQQQQEHLENLSNKYNEFIQNIRKKTSEEIEDFLDYATLNELANKYTGKTKGYNLGKFYTSAFKTLIELDFKIEKMTVCWRAY